MPVGFDKAFPNLSPLNQAAAFRFAANADRVQIPANAKHQGLDPWTVMAWVYPTTFTSTRIIIWRGAVGGINTRIGLQLNGTTGGLRAYVDKVTSPITYDTVDCLVLNRWNFVTAQYDSTRAANDLIRVWVGFDEQPAALVAMSAISDGTGAAVVDSSTVLDIGNDGAGSPIKAWQGLIRQVFLGRQFLEADEIRDWQANYYAPTRGTVGLWWLGAAGLAPVADDSGNGLRTLVPAGVTTVGTAAGVGVRPLLVAPWFAALSVTPIDFGVSWTPTYPARLPRRPVPLVVSRHFVQPELFANKAVVGEVSSPRLARRTSGPRVAIAEPLDYTPTSSQWYPKYPDRLRVWSRATTTTTTQFDVPFTTPMAPTQWYPSYPDRFRAKSRQSTTTAQFDVPFTLPPPAVPTQWYPRYPDRLRSRSRLQTTTTSFDVPFALPPAPPVPDQWYPRYPDPSRRTVQRQSGTSQFTVAFQLTDVWFPSYPDTPYLLWWPSEPLTTSPVTVPTVTPFFPRQFYPVYPDLVLRQRARTSQLVIGPVEPVPASAPASPDQWFPIYPPQHRRAQGAIAFPAFIPGETLMVPPLSWSGRYPDALTHRRPAGPPFQAYVRIDPFVEPSLVGVSGEASSIQFARPPNFPQGLLVEPVAPPSGQVFAGVSGEASSIQFARPPSFPQGLEVGPVGLPAPQVFAGVTGEASSIQFARPPSFPQGTMVIPLVLPAPQEFSGVAGEASSIHFARPTRVAQGGTVEPVVASTFDPIWAMGSNRTVGLIIEPK